MYAILMECNRIDDLEKHTDIDYRDHSLYFLPERSTEIAFGRRSPSEIIPMQILFLFSLSKCGKVHSRDARQLHIPEGVQEWEASWPIKTHATVCGVVLFLECDCQSRNLRLGLVRWRRQNSGSLNHAISPVGPYRSKENSSKMGSVLSWPNIRNSFDSSLFSSWLSGWGFPCFS